MNSLEHLIGIFLLLGQISYGAQTKLDSFSEDIFSTKRDLAALLATIEVTMTKNAQLFAVQSQPNCAVSLTVVLCKDSFSIPSVREKIFNDFNRQLRQISTMLKSVAIAEAFTSNILGMGRGRKCVQVGIIANDIEVFKSVEEMLQLDERFRNVMELVYIPVKYPNGYEWMTRVYRPCATARLFLDSMLPTTDATIYVDTDFIFLKSLQHLWLEFENFGELTVAGIVPEEFRQFMGRINGYNPYSYNPGVMLMNLTRMREIQWSDRLGMISTMFLKDARYGDQDMLIMYFQHFPHQRLNLPCHWNFAPRNCRFSQKCASEGISALHGLVGAFIGNPYDHEFKKMFNSFEATNLSRGADFRIDSFIDDVENTLLAKGRASKFCSRKEDFSDLVLKSMKEMHEFEQPNEEYFMGNVFTLKSHTASSESGSSQMKVETGLDEVKLRIAAGDGCVQIVITVCVWYEHPRHIEHPTTIEQTLVLIKSLLLMENSIPDPTCLNVTIVAPRFSTFETIWDEVHSWEPKFTQLLHLNYIEVTFPSDFEWMKHIFKRCATARIFYPDILPPSYQAVIHLDTDMIFTRPVSQLWKQFLNFSDTTVMATAPQLNSEQEERESQVYFRPTKHQAGVILMNITRLRQVGFTSKIKMIAVTHKNILVLPVQEMFGIYFHYFPEQIQFLSCDWNFLPHYCFDAMEYCAPFGISVIHAVNNSFRSDSFEPQYMNIFHRYEALDAKDMADFSWSEFLDGIETDLLDGEKAQDSVSLCASPSFRNTFFSRMRTLRQETYVESPETKQRDNYKSEL